MQELLVQEDRLNIIECVGSSKKTLKEIVEDNQKEEATNADYASNKIDRDGRIVSISQKALEFISKKADWIKKYPVLTLEFEENGQRKKTSEILQQAIICSDKSIQDIYSKIFESEITVSLEDTIETLGYISKILGDNKGASKEIEKFVSLIIKNEVFTSLRDMEINDPQCKDVLSKLEEISKNNPNLEASEFIKEKLKEFSKNGRIDVEIKKDKVLSDSATTAILNRKIETMEDFNLVLADLQKVLVENGSFNLQLELGFRNLFRKCFDKDLEFDVMLDKSLKIAPESSRDVIIEGFWEDAPNDKKSELLKRFVDISSKYRKIDFRFAYQTMMQLPEELQEGNMDFEKGIFKKYISKKIIPFLKVPKNIEELDERILEAKKCKASKYDIKEVLGEVIKVAADKGYSDAPEMLYREMEFAESHSDMRYAIKTFYIYATPELKEKKSEEILRHILVDKAYLDKSDASEIIDYAKQNIESLLLNKNPELDSKLEQIRTEAFERIESIKPERRIFGRRKPKIEQSEVEYIEIEEIEEPEQEETEQLQALQKITAEVPATDISVGKSMIKAFLAKAKGVKNKIEMFFGGGDDHDVR